MSIKTILLILTSFMISITTFSSDSSVNSSYCEGFINSSVGDVPDCAVDESLGKAYVVKKQKKAPVQKKKYVPALTGQVATSQQVATPSQVGSSQQVATPSQVGSTQQVAEPVTASSSQRFEYSEGYDSDLDSDYLSW